MFLSLSSDGLLRRSSRSACRYRRTLLLLGRSLRRASKARPTQDKNSLKRLEHEAI